MPVSVRTRDQNKKEQVRAANHKMQMRKRQLVTDAKNVPCKDCGIRWPACAMDLHHHSRGDKLFPIGPAIASVGYSKLLEEIAKCDVLCANCHRIRTWLTESISPSEFLLWQYGIN